MADKLYIPCRLFDMRLVYTSALWTPQAFKKAKPGDTNTPQYMATIITPKTDHNARGLDWTKEKLLQPLADASRQLYSAVMSNFPADMIQWPVIDGNLPNSEGKTPEWAKNNWIIRASSNTQPQIEGVVDGKAVQIPAQSMGGRKLWDDGDYAVVDIVLAQNQNDVKKFKQYFNTVLFVRPGERIQTGASRASGDELLRAAQERGIQASGLNGAPLPSGTGVDGPTFNPPSFGATGDSKAPF